MCPFPSPCQIRQQSTTPSSRDVQCVHSLPPIQFAPDVHHLPLQASPVSMPLPLPVMPLSLALPFPVHMMTPSVPLPLLVPMPMPLYTPIVCANAPPFFFTYSSSPILLRPFQLLVISERLCYSPPGENGRTRGERSGISRNRHQHSTQAVCRVCQHTSSGRR